MENLLVSTLKQEITSLREQLVLIEHRSEEIHVVLAELEDRLHEMAQRPSHELIVEEPEVQESEVTLTEGDELPEIEVEIVVDESYDEEDEVEDDIEPIEEPIEDETSKGDSDVVPTIIEETIEEHEVVEEPTIIESIQLEEEPEVVVVESGVTIESHPVQSSASKPTANMVSLPHIEEIRKGISLGDRFLFQRELFAGDGEKMNKTIDTLDKMSNLDEVMAYISKRFNWDTESQAYELFINVLRRRF